MSAVELCESAPSAFEFVPDDEVERHLRDCLVEDLVLGLGMVVDDLVEISTERHAENRLGARVILVIAVVDEIGRVLNVELDDRHPVVEDQLITPVVLGELHRLVHVLVGREHVAVRLAVGVGLTRLARIRPIESCGMVLGPGDDLRLLAVHDTPHFDLLDPLLVIGDDLEAVADAKRRAGDVTGIGRERLHSFFGREMRAQHGHVLRGRALDWEPSEKGTILLSVHDFLLSRY